MLEDDNKGLKECLEKHNIPEVYNSVKDIVSLADFFVIAAEAATGRTATDFDKNDYYKEGTLP